ncbi:MAG: hypothetical protein FJX57_21315, partial [Alphaproteobacteria bacterium]|nr:hypothetical protein [Alphaproteobacteria bacterium]
MLRGTMESPPPLWPVICVGGAAIDHGYWAIAPLQRDTSNPARGRTGFGGVARNVAETLTRLGCRAALVSAVGDDVPGRSLLTQLGTIGIGVAHVHMIAGAATASYVAALDSDGSLAFGLSDMAVLEAVTPARVAAARALLRPGGWVFADCNLDAATLTELAALTRQAGGHLAVDAVSVAKAVRAGAVLERIALLFLNRDEAQALMSTSCAAPDDLAAMLLARGVATVVLTLGEAGAIV